MNRTSWGARLACGLLIAVTATIGVACTTPPTPLPPITPAPWLAAGCFTGLSLPDLYFNGQPGLLANVTRHSEGSSCAAPVGPHMTLVRASSLTDANTMCLGLGVGSDNAAQPGTIGWTGFPADAWFCPDFSP